MQSSYANRVIAIIYGIVCHSLFLIAVVTMIVCMYSGMQLGLGNLTKPYNWLANLFLILQFIFFHSFLLSHKQSLLYRLAPSKFAPQLASTTYVIFVSMQTFILFALWSPSGIIWWQAQGVTLFILTICYSFAWILLFKSMSDAGLGLQTGFLGWRSVLKNIKPLYPPMPQLGLFKLCRQPIYLSFTLTLWTVPVWTPDQLLLAFSLTLYCLLGPLLKENRFLLRYGKDFSHYQQRVNYWLPWPRTKKRNPQHSIILNDQKPYEIDAQEWWTGKRRWLRVLHNIVPLRIKYFAKIIGSWDQKTVLDIGCGGGFMSEAIAQKGAQVTAIDPCHSAITVAKQHAETNHLKIDYRVGSGENLSFNSNSFDIVVIVDVLEHVNDVNRVLAEIYRVLKPGGILLFDTINRNWLASIVFILLGEKILRVAPRGTHDPALFIKPQQLQTMLRQQGFKPGPMQGFGPIALNRRLDFIFAMLPTTVVQYFGYALKKHT